MSNIIVAVLSVVFLFLAGIHFYWSFGGTWGEDAAIPTAQWVRYGIMAMVAAFSLRAAGDFRYVGFFKKIRSTKFARMDLHDCKSLKSKMLSKK